MEGSSSKKTKRSNIPMLLGALIVLVLVAVLVADPFHWIRPTDADIAAKNPERRVLVDVKAAELTAIEIAQPEKEQPFRLERDKDRWYVLLDGKRTKADMERVDKLLEELPGLRADSLTTSDEKQYDDLEVSDGKAIMLKVYKEATKPLASLHVGKAAPGYQTSFVRLDGGKEVWRAARNIKTLVGYTAEDFRTKKPWTFKAETATKVSIQKFVAGAEDTEQHTAAAPDAIAPRVTFSLDGGLWKKDGANGNQNAIKELLNALSDLQVNEYAKAEDPLTKSPSGRQPALEVETPEGKLSLTFGGKDSSYFFIQDQDGNVYKVSEYNLNFYRELDFDKLAFDDMPKEEAKKEEDANKQEAGASSEKKGNG